MQTHPVSPEGGFLIEKLIKAAATGLGLGYVPVAPGTAGTLLGIPLFLVLYPLSPPIFLAALIGCTGSAFWITGRAERIFQEKDSQKIVLDEIIGFLWTMGFISPTPAHLAAGFLLFRLLDITKPFPAGFLQRKAPGGYGVVLDDVAAGIYGNILLHLAIRVFGF
ncbi:MAG: phosphatidylglycerophosphatase A [Syntrophales bacterium]